MTHSKHCQRGIPLQHGIHLSELEMVKCERSDLALEPMEPVPKVKWYQPKKKSLCLSLARDLYEGLSPKSLCSRVAQYRPARVSRCRK